MLRSLRGQLAEALAEVQGGAARLHLRTKTAARLSGEEAVLLEAAQERGNLFASAIQAVVASAQSCAHVSAGLCCGQKFACLGLRPLLLCSQMHRSGAPNVGPAGLLIWLELIPSRTGKSAQWHVSR